jgi:hypothetical protein
MAFSRTFSLERIPRTHIPQLRWPDYVTNTGSRGFLTTISASVRPLHLQDSSLNFPNMPTPSPGPNLNTSLPEALHNTY